MHWKIIAGCWFYSDNWLPINTFKRYSIVHIFEALGIFLNNNESFNGSISLLITGDEEGDAINGTKKVVDYLVRYLLNKLLSPH